MRKLSDSEVKEIQMHILDDVHEFCTANNLRYTLIGGSMLGAARHKGFIPWDDDIDIGLPRPDFERFMESYAPKQPYYKALDYRHDKNYVSAFAKVYDTRTHTRSVNIIDNRSVYIDVFPIDGAPENDDELTAYMAKVTKLLEDLRRSGKYFLYTNSPMEKCVFLLKYAIKRLRVPSTERLQLQLANLLNQYDFNSSQLVGNLVGRWGGENACPKQSIRHLSFCRLKTDTIMALQTQTPI